MNKQKPELDSGKTSETGMRRQHLINRIKIVAFFLSFGFICVFMGFLTTILNVFPSSFFFKAFVELTAVDPFQTDLYILADSPKSGVTRYNPKRAYNGYTILTSAHTQGAFLIDMNGRVVHKWALPYNRVWNKDAAVEYPSTTKFMMWDKAFLYANGDLLAVYVCWGQGPLWGYGLVKMDQHSNPKWAYLQRVHHDVTVGPDGKIYALGQSFLEQPIPELSGIKLPAIDNSVVVLSAEGKVLRNISVLQAFARSKYKGILALNRDMENRDVLHLNSIVPMPPGFRRTFPFAGPNTVLISSRTLSSIALLDLDSEKIIWLQRGPFVRQHDAEFLSNGNMMVFDDVGDAVYGEHSRVIEFQPDPFKLVWEFPGDTGETLDSEIMGAAQKLPNGNVLISDDDNGRIIEVTSQKKVVWEYKSPFRQGDKRQFVPIIRWAHRFAPVQLHFDFN